MTKKMVYQEPGLNPTERSGQLETRPKPDTLQTENFKSENKPNAK